MDPERDGEDQHPQCGAKPKVVLAGRIEGTVNGQPANIVAENNEVTLTLTHLRTFLALRGVWTGIASQLTRVAGGLGIRLTVRIGWLGKLELLPKPGFLVRFLLPKV